MQCLYPMSPMWKDPEKNLRNKMNSEVLRQRQEHFMKKLEPILGKQRYKNSNIFSNSDRQN